MAKITTVLTVRRAKYLAGVPIAWTVVLTATGLKPEVVPCMAHES